jgi:Terminase small subunit
LLEFRLLLAFRKAGCVAKNDHVADTNSFRLEKKPGVRERIEYLARQAQERVIEKRGMLEEQLWAVHEADIGAFWETYEAAKTSKDGGLETDQDGRMVTVRKQRPKLINDLPLEARKLIEDVTVDRNGNVIPKLYSRLQANAELRKMHHIGRTEDQTDISRLSDAELVAQLAEQAKQLGIEIDLNYSFAQPAPSTDAASEPTEVNGGQVIDNAVEPTAADCSGANAGNERDAQAAKELMISASPAIPQRRQGSTEAGARNLHRNKR